METEYRREKRKEEDNIYDEYNALIADPRNQKMAVMKHILKKYKKVAPSTIYATLRRVAARRNDQ